MGGTVQIDELVAAFDSESGKIGTIDISHAEIHEGNSYQGNHDFGIITSGGGTVSALFQPNGIHPHLEFYGFVADSAPVGIDMYEDPTLSGAGSDPDLVRGLKRNKTNPDDYTATLTVNPTIDNIGDLIEQNFVVGNKKEGGSATIFYSEYNLDPDLNYVFQLTNKSTSDTEIANFSTFWYEHEHD